MSNKTIIIDGSKHIAGRLASTVAKAALQGQKIVVVRCENILISGPMRRNENIFKEFLRKTQITNPRRGPFHHRSPANIFLRKVRGMIPYKTTKGMEALERIQVFEGVPTLYQKKKRAIVPSALQVVALKPESPVTKLGDLAVKFGWKYAAVVAEQEAERKKVGVAFYKKTVAKANLWKQAEQKSASNSDFQKVVSQLAQYGY